MKKKIVPILTEEYKIVVYIGTPEELAKSGAKYLELDKDEMESLLSNQRGIAYDSLRAGLGKPPIIFIDGDQDYISAIATIAHEASHAMDYIQRYLGIDDRAGEIHGHGIASVLRHTLKLLKRYE
jgi:hypothetical protein